MRGDRNRMNIKAARDLPLHPLAPFSSPGSQRSKACRILAVPWDSRHRPWGLSTGCPRCLKISPSIATWLLPSLLLSLYSNTTFSMVFSIATFFKIEAQGLFFLLKHTCSRSLACLGGDLGFVP